MFDISIHYKSSRLIRNKIVFKNTLEFLSGSKLYHPIKICKNAICHKLFTNNLLKNRLVGQKVNLLDELSFISTVQ